MEKTEETEKTNENFSSSSMEIESDNQMESTTGGFLANSCRRGRRGICVSISIFAIVIGCILLAFTAFASPTQNPETLQQVSVIFRHGDRNPAKSYPNDPYLNYEWPDGFSALTKKGLIQVYHLGQRLREMYGTLIGNKYQSTNLLVRSSYADRCIMSAQALLAALYPPAPEDIFIPGLAWRPIPVYTIPRETDKLIVAKASCPRLERELAQAYENFTRDHNSTLTTIYKELSSYSGMKISTLVQAEFLYNTLEIEKSNGLVLPDWTKKYYDRELRELAEHSLAIFTSNVAQRRLRGGPLLKEILDDMAMRLNGTDKHKLYIYSGHDLTLVNLIRTMGFTNEMLRPDYGAAIIFELYASVGNDQTHRVQISYLNNTETKVPHAISVPGCEEPCTLEMLYKIWQPVLPVKWEQECIT